MGMQLLTDLVLTTKEKAPATEKSVQAGYNSSL
jgi:hypothetical protein